MTGHVTFEVQLSSDRRAIPEWMWGGPISFRVDLDTLAKLYGPVGNLTPDEIVKLNLPELRHHANRKVQRLAERPPEPVHLVYEDFLNG